MSKPLQLLDLTSIVENLHKAKLLCIGDLMIDHFVYGEVERISPEAPVPVLHVQREFSTLGGAGNVARNLAELGVHVDFITVIGHDEAGTDTQKLLQELTNVSAHLLVDSLRPTTSKTRFIVGGQQMLRADREKTMPISQLIQNQILSLVEKHLPSSDLIILSDYGKGLMTTSLCQAIIGLARRFHKQVVVDPKGYDYSKYEGATLLTPNRKELKEISKVPVDTLERVVTAAHKVMNDTKVDSILVTLGKEGMVLAQPDEDSIYVNATAREVFDVSGAGDTVIATLSACLALKAPIDLSIRLANIAAGIVVGKIGTATITPQDLQDALDYSPQDSSLGHKIMSLETAVEQVNRWKHLGHKVGFTNGCFDILHPGHVTYLHQARAKCDRLILGLNSDESIRRLKGPSRPINESISRALVLASLASVDLIVVFDEDTPLKLIETFKPNVLIKGADYTIDQVVGATQVQSYGGEIYLAPLVEGHSTTKTITKLSLPSLTGHIS